jgi:hypothetical protein
MVEDKNNVLKALNAHIKMLTLVLEDEEVRNSFEQLLVKEMQLYENLLHLENKTIPTGESITYGQFAEKKLKLSWKDWLEKIFKKLNSLLGSLIPTGGN